jgi:hypothetical protein
LPVQTSEPQQRFNLFTNFHTLKSSSHPMFKGSFAFYADH